MEMKGLVKIGTLFSIAALVGVTAFGAVQPADAHDHCYRHWQNERCENWRWRQHAMYNSGYYNNGYNNGYYNNPYYNAYGYRPTLFTRMGNRLF
jgi:hypothetical protein